MTLRNALGHDKFGHRHSNNLSRAGVTSIAELRLVSDARLLELRDFGLAGLQRVRSARLKRAPRASH
jgi:DNA-directed RNA polymerase alpha subunit